MTDKAPKTPANLGAAGRRLWQRANKVYEIEPIHCDLLEQACRALDRAESCRAQIDRDGEAVTDRFGQKRKHPLLDAEAQARNQFRQLYKALGLGENEDEQRGPGRPPRDYCV